ncbi:methyltransferase N6AMT1-like [Ruditapes philippinarum]|uniref:methyltransferase N6AMT1-like n=1 Tax=Ruditapes philippinarum TaxID=129788 RepID=UPI00295C1CAA|nr:methyltransferase N6AMT1-like [Ruditapes philippinarum]
MSTPDISHISSEDYSLIYEPAEDSFLFLDALEKEINEIQEIRPQICLEIGSGSGIVSTFLAKEIRLQLLSIILFIIVCFLYIDRCTDINPRAVSITKTTGLKNGVSLEAVLTDLVDGLAERLKKKVDILLFNPPYVVTPSEEVGSSGIEASWAGGANGREVINRFLPLVPELLSNTGIFYMVVIKENNPDEIGSILSKSGLKMSTVLERRSGPEFLSVLKFMRES